MIQKIRNLDPVYYVLYCIFIVFLKYVYFVFVNPGSFGVAAPQGLFPFLGLSAGLCYFPAVPGYYLGVLDSLASFSCGGWVSRYLDHRLGTFAR